MEYSRGSESFLRIIKVEEKEDIHNSNIIWMFRTQHFILWIGYYVDL